MNRQTIALSLTLIFFGSFQSLGQTDNDNRNLALQYAKEANRLDLQNDPDSITQAYNLHCKVLTLDKIYVPSYRSKIAIEYKRGNYNDALNTAISFVTNLPAFGEAWVYLGFVQAKLNDTTGATNSFKRAIAVFETLQSEVKDKNWKSTLGFKIGIVKQLLTNGEKGVAVTTKRGTRVSMNIGDTHSVNEYVEKFMTYNGVQFF